MSELTPKERARCTHTERRMFPYGNDSYCDVCVLDLMHRVRLGEATVSELPLVLPLTPREAHLKTFLFGKPSD